MSDNKKKLTAADWATVVTMVQRGEKTIRDLADMFGVSPQAIHKGLRVRGVQPGSRLGEITAEVIDAAGEARKAKVTAAHATAERFIKYHDLIVQMTVTRIIDAKAVGSISAANADILTLKNGMAIISRGRAEAWDMSKIDEMLQEDEDLAVLNVGEYTEAELGLIREGNEAAYQESVEDVDALDLNIDFDEDDDEAEDLIAI